MPDAAERAALLSRATLSNAQLRPGPLAEVAGHLLEDADIYQAQLKKIRLHPAVNALVKGHVDAFAATVGTTCALQKGSQGTRASTSSLLQEFMTQAYELDDAMQVFRVLDPALHAAHLLARKIGKSGGKKSPAKPGSRRPA